MTIPGPREGQTEPLRFSDVRQEPAARDKTISGHRLLRAVDGDTENAFQPKVRSLPMRRVPIAEDVAARPSGRTPAVSSAREPLASHELPKPFATPEPQSRISAALELGERALRLTMDGILIVVFSPVIAAWWMLERRHKKGRG